MIISDQALTSFIESVFLKLGFAEDRARIAAANLTLADLRGIDSHGVARLSGYVRLVRAGRINPAATPRIVHSTPSTATLDGDGGLGLWVAHEAMKIAIDKARTAGSGWVAVKNSSHFGIAAAHAMMALEHDMIGFAVTNASPLVAPAGAAEPYLGTNPICIAIPSGHHLPFVLDMATSAAANGKLEIAQRAGKPIPEGWVQNAEGTPTTDPFALKDGGVLLPLGSNPLLGYHKGYGLGAAVDILSGVLSGANFGRWVPPFVSFLDVAAESPGAGIGHFLGVWRVDAFGPAEDFKARMDHWIDGVKALKPSPGIEEVLVPGEPEARTAIERAQNGIPLSDKVWEDMKKLAGELEVELGNGRA